MAAADTHAAEVADKLAAEAVDTRVGVDMRAPVVVAEVRVGPAAAATRPAADSPAVDAKRVGPGVDPAAEGDIPHRSVVPGAVAKSRRAPTSVAVQAALDREWGRDRMLAEAARE